MHHDATSLERLNHLVADAESRVTEQVLLVESMEHDGLDTAAARKLLRTFEAILTEAFIAQKTMMERREAATLTPPEPQVRG